MADLLDAEASHDKWTKRHAWSQLLQELFEAFLVFVLLIVSLPKLNFNSSKLEWTGDISLAIRSEFNFYFFVGVLEIFLALLIVVGSSRRQLWAALVSLFACSIGYGTYQILIGNNSCHCFGSIATPRLFSVGLSAICLFGLFGGYRKWFRIFPPTMRLPPAVFVGASFCVGYAIHVGSDGTYLGRYIRSDRLTSRPIATRVLMDMFQGEAVAVEVRVVNNSFKESIQLIGVHSHRNLTCYSSDLPLQLGPGAAANMKIKISGPPMDRERLPQFVEACENNPERSPFHSRLFDDISFVCADGDESCSTFTIEIAPIEANIRLYRQLQQKIEADSPTAAAADFCFGD